jgi:nucleotide-binding universal stress UspA family protein
MLLSARPSLAWSPRRERLRENILGRMLWEGNATTAGGWEAALVLGIIVPQSNLGSMESGMYERILVAIDGSVTSDLALREAIGLAKDQDAMLRLVHVVDLTPPASMTTETGSAVALHFPLAEYQKALQEAGEKSLATRATAARDAGVNVDTKLITVGTLGERIHEAIEEQSKQWPADLIVVGTEGRRGFQRLMIGSVAEGLVRISTKPVLLIRGT